jgi:hypothetical protein
MRKSLLRAWVSERISGDLRLSVTRSGHEEMWVKRKEWDISNKCRIWYKMAVIVKVEEGIL